MIGISHELLDSLRLINTPQNSLRFSEMQCEKEITTSWHTVKATLRVCLSSMRMSPSKLFKNVPIWAEVNSDGDIKNERQRKTSFGVDGADQKEGNNLG